MFRQLCQFQYMVLDRKMTSHFLPALVIKAGKYGHCQNLRTLYAQLICRDFGITGCGLHHGPAAAGMDRNQVHSQPGDGSHAVAYGIGNIMEFQVQEYLFPCSFR